MYKVFFYNTEFIFCQKTDNPNKIKYLYQIDFIDSLLNNSLSEVFYLYDEDINKMWEHFNSYFLEIHAAGGVVENSQSDILFIHRLGKWDLPKGKVEQDEDYPTAALREVEEECGITNLKIENFIKNTYHIYTLNNQYVLKTTHWYKMTYIGNEKLVPQTEEDIDIAKWVSPSESKSLIENSYKNIQELFKNTIA